MVSEKLKVTGTAGPGSQYGMRVPRRYISGHNDEGKAIYLEDPPILFRSFGDFESAHTYAMTSVPEQMNGDADLKAYLSSDESNPASQYNLSPSIPNGVNMVMVNYAPGASTHMHRTVSIDTTICIEGHLAMETDSGEVKEFFPGDQIIQRGTAHRWINLSKDKPARTIGILVDAHPIVIGGKELKEEHHQ
ncbi:hypothetical protein NX059_005970 [Plenodomus lindquistii]|nr:hypothetical protein NX059_005970 [Plenodomus lindquistii]